MSEPADWIEALRQCHRRRREGGGSTLMQLATLTADGSPAVRTVVIRDVEIDGGVLFSSDARSRKNTEVRLDPRASGVMWFRDDAMQFRLSGRCEIVKDDKLRERVWRDKHGDKARALFAWPTPGEARAAEDAFAEAVPAEAPVPATFEVLRLTPTTVETLSLDGVPHDRVVCEPDGDGWRSQRVNP